MGWVIIHIQLQLEITVIYIELTTTPHRDVINMGRTLSKSGSSTVREVVSLRR